MRKKDDLGKLAKAQEEYRQEEKQKMIDSFEKFGAKRTSYSIRYHETFREFLYGVPAIDYGKLKGFYMMKFTQSYGRMAVNSDISLCKDENGKQVFMTVDEYYDFYKELEKEDSRIGALIRKSKEKEGIADKVLKDNRISKLRNKIAKKIDRTLGTDLEKIKMPKFVKKAENKLDKIISKIIFGKVKE